MIMIILTIMFIIMILVLDGRVPGFGEGAELYYSVLKYVEYKYN